jgi:hypothetical protein
MMAKHGKKMEQRRGLSISVCDLWTVMVVNLVLMADVGLGSIVPIMSGRFCSSLTSCLEISVILLLCPAL